MLNAQGIPIVNPPKMINKKSFFHTVFDVDVLLHYGSTLVGSTWKNSDMCYLSIHPYYGDEGGFLVYYNKKKTSYLSAALNGLVVDGFVKKEVERKRHLNEASDIIGAYLSNIKYPIAEYKPLSRVEKRKSKIYHKKFSSVLVELISQKYTPAPRLRGSTSSLDKNEESEIFEEDYIFDKEDEDIFYKEDVYLSSISTKDKKIKSIKSNPPSHFQRYSKKQKKAIYYERKAHDKYKYISPQEGFESVENQKEFIQYWTECEKEYRMYGSDW